MKSGAKPRACIARNSALPEIPRLRCGKLLRAMDRHAIHLHGGENLRQVAAERIELLLADRQIVAQSGSIFTAGDG